MSFSTKEYFVKETYKSIRRNGFMSFASISTVAVSLLVLGMFLMIFLNTNNLAQYLESQVQVSVYMQDSATDKELTAVKEKLTKMPGVVKVTQVSKQQALEQAQKTAQDDALRCQIMAEHLPDEPLPDPDALLPQPEMPHAQILALIPQLMADIQTARTRLDTLQGQIQSLGSMASITQQRQIKSEQLANLQAEYDALQMAMEALEGANLTLQNRFSPALGARAAEIFSAITAGRYHKVLLSRDFSLSAEAANDPTGRSIQLLSQGAADQLYLAVRLAICDMVLPTENAVPLILDDALLSFDERRLHAALDYLVQESQKRQILLFSCQMREQRYLADREGVHCLWL